jgi:hypothetical protein
MLCKICGFHGGDYEEYRLLGCDAVWLLQLVLHGTNSKEAFLIDTAVKKFQY